VGRGVRRGDRPTARAGGGPRRNLICNLQEGGAIEVIYSQRRPKVSAPKYLMDVVKTAKATIRIDARE
jgi:hypothetical protein